MRNVVGQILGMLLLSFFCVAVVAAQAFTSSVVVATSSSALNYSSSSSCTDDESIIIRGGDDRGGIDTETRDVILRFLDTATTKSESSTTYPFHIQGWRWHFMSLSRDAQRLRRLANHLLSNDGSGDDYDIDGFNALQEASNYVINFNMAGLYRIQSNMFLKFIREHLCDEDSIREFIENDDNDVLDETTGAFNRLVDIIDAYRIQSERIGRELVSILFAMHIIPCMIYNLCDSG